MSAGILLPGRRTRGVRKKDGTPGAALASKGDSYGLETEVHFPTDLNRLWDAARKCVDWVEKFRRGGEPLPGWRKAKARRRPRTACERVARHIGWRGGPDNEARVQRAVRDCLGRGPRSLREGAGQPAGPVRPTRGHGALGNARMLPPEARPASEPGGTPFVKRGNHSAAPESVFTV